MLRLYRQWKARRALQRMVDAKRESFELQQFRKNRAAQVKRRGLA